MKRRKVPESLYELFPSVEKKWAEVLRREEAQAGAWMARHRDELAEVIDGPQNGIPNPMRAETLSFMVWERGKWHMPDIRVFPWLLLLVRARCSQAEVVARAREGKGPAYDSDVSDQDEDAWAKERVKERRQWNRDHYGVEPAALVIYLRRKRCERTLPRPLWVADVPNRPKSLPADTKWPPEKDCKEWKRSLQVRAHRELYPLTDWPAPYRLRLPDGAPVNPHFDPFPRQRFHTRAGNKAEVIKHECTAIAPGCQCHRDERPFTSWRPWADPFFRRPLDAALFETFCPHVGFKPPYKAPTLYLKRLVWENRSTEPEAPVKTYKDWRSIAYYTHCRAGIHLELKVRACWPGEADVLPWHVRYWEYFFHSAKVRQMRESPGDYAGQVTSRLQEHMEMLPLPAHGHMGICVDLDHTIIRRKVRVKKTPGYKLHDSAAAVMAYLGCSRATAFRKIKAGFKIPVGELV